MADEKLNTGPAENIAPDSLDFRQSRTFRIGQYLSLIHI